MPTPLAWRLTPIQLDQVWESLGLEEYPFPFEVASFGATDEERAQLRRRVREELTAGGLLRRDRLDADLEWALRLIANPERSVDSVWLASGDSPHRTLAALGGNRAVLAVQQPGPAEHEGGELTLREVPPSALVPAVIGELPGQRPGTKPGGSTAAGQPQRQPATQEGGLMRAAAYGRGRDERQLDELLGVEHAAVGQLGVTVREPSGRKSHTQAVSWFDNAGDGRYLVVASPGQDGREWVTVAPADANALGQRVHDTLRRALSRLSQR